MEPTAADQAHHARSSTRRAPWGRDEQVKPAQELFRIWADNVFEIGTVGLTPMVQGVVVVNTKFRNVPTTLGNDWPLRSPGNARTEQFFFAN